MSLDSPTSAGPAPHYNRAIGNTTEYSRHLYGDGRVTRADAQYLARLVRRHPTPGDAGFNGGLGIYGPAPHRGPFVHIDLRGYRARWENHAR